uniref:Uncharacterized protein n=1 Tax=Opuntia streptacantha TaxID=393608 RepID=A0A7C8ZY02_OPUST
MWENWHVTTFGRHRHSYWKPSLTSELEREKERENEEEDSCDRSIRLLGGKALLRLSQPRLFSSCLRSPEQRRLRTPRRRRQLRALFRRRHRLSLSPCRLLWLPHRLPLRRPRRAMASKPFSLLHCIFLAPSPFFLHYWIQEA